MTYDPDRRNEPPAIDCCAVCGQPLPDRRKASLTEAAAGMTDRAKLLAMCDRVTAEHTGYSYAEDDVRALASALKHFLEAAPHRYGSATLDDMAELDAAPALQEDIAHHAVSLAADGGIRVGSRSLPPVATPPAAVTMPTREEIAEQIYPWVWNTNYKPNHGDERDHYKEAGLRLADRILALIASKGDGK